MDINKILDDPKMREALIKRLIKEEGLAQFKGEVSLVVTGPDGTIKGKRLVRNLIVSVGLYHIMDRLLYHLLHTIYKPPNIYKMIS